MGRKSKFQLQQEQQPLSAIHYVQYSTLRTYVDISREVLEELVHLRKIHRYKPHPDSTVSLYSLEEVQKQISTCKL